MPNPGTRVIHYCVDCVHFKLKGAGRDGAVCRHPGARDFVTKEQRPCTDIRSGPECPAFEPAPVQAPPLDVQRILADPQVQRWLTSRPALSGAGHHSEAAG